MSGVDQKVLQTASGLAGEHGLRILGTLRKPVKPEPVEQLLISHCRLAKLSDTLGDGYSPLSSEEVALGLKQGAIEMYFQPKVDVKTMRIIGAEALARWRHSARGVLGPGTFVPVAEQSGQVEALTKSVIGRSLSAYSELLAEGLRIGISINVCAENLEDLSFPEFVIAAVETAGISPSQITLEITESRVARDALSAMEVMTRLRLKDITLSIDDFGTGFASLEQLKKLPFTELKIDRGFVNGAGRDPETRAILESSVRLARDLRLHIVAEGVENQDDWRLVAALGCHTVQGFFVAKPMPATKLPGWVREWERAH